MNISSELDGKNVTFGNVIHPIRQDIDVHRIISLNSESIRAVGASGVFFGYVQMLALTSVALNLRKIYEDSTRWPLCSIPVIVRGLLPIPPAAHMSEQFKEYAINYGGNAHALAGAAIIQSAFDAIRARHLADLERLKDFRDKMVAHREYGVEIKTLPSHEVFEQLWGFAYETYRLIHRQYNDVCGALPSRQVASGLRRTLQKLGVEKPKMLFPDQLPEVKSD